VRGHREGLCLAPRSQAWLTDGHWYITYGPVPIAGRTPAYPTPTGTFHVLSKDATYHSTEFHNAPMPYSGFFYPGDAFHADNVHQKSHGCIHLTMTDAKIFSPCSTSVTGCRFGPEGSNKLIHFGWVGNGRAVPARTWWRALAAESRSPPTCRQRCGCRPARARSAAGRPSRNREICSQRCMPPWPSMANLSRSFMGSSVHARLTRQARVFPPVGWRAALIWLWSALRAAT
jgi:hypothetical protein